MLNIHSGKIITDAGIIYDRETSKLLLMLQPVLKIYAYSDEWGLNFVCRKNQTFHTVYVIKLHLTLIESSRSV